jgi:hypothetical protein
MSPYALQTVTDAEHEWYMQLSAHAATVAAQALARGTMRLGVAHRYMAAAHLAALFDGLGEGATRVFLDELVRDLTDENTFWTKEFLAERAADMRAKR